MAKNVHLTLQDRSTIQSSLVGGLSFKEIAAQLGKDPTTISKEVRNHIDIVENGSYGRGFNPCVHRRNCKVTYLCSYCTQRNPKCSLCSKCSSLCKDFEEEHCSKLSRPPYVCNGCPERQRCTLRKHMYNASHAQQEYEQLRSESRQGLATDPEELARINNVITPLLKQGQSIHHVCENNRDLIMLSERTMYNYLTAGAFDAGPLDLPRMVRMRPRKTSVEKKIDRDCYDGRTYVDFLQFTSDNPDTSVVEMDSVIGRKGGKVLLTIFFRNSNLMLAYLRDNNSARSVLEVMDHLHNTLGSELYSQLFPVILSDRGSEFSNPKALEYDAAGNLRSLVFYCDPSSPYQKGGCEVCHEMVRRVLPKGSSFDHLQQEDIDLMMSHINSYTREKLNNRSAHQMFSFLYGVDVLDRLNIHEIQPNDIILKPYLLKK